jgi:hypothetical protein
MNGTARRLWLLGSGVLVLGFALAAITPVSRAGRHASLPAVVCPPPVCDVCEPPPGSVFRAGDEAANLQVHVVGTRFDTLEVYFSNQYFFRDKLNGAGDLRLDNSVILAPANPYGTFAVRYGPGQETFKVYGWKTNETSPVSFGPIAVDPGSPACLRWVTPRILKVTYGPEQSKTFILRFNDSDKPWTVLYRG